MSEITLLRGRVRLLQPEKGFRASIDTVLLAAYVPEAKDGAQILDVGCGTGAAGLCALTRQPGLQLTGIDVQPDLIELARQNAALNHVDQTCRFVAGHIMSETDTPDHSFDIVMMNPPYQEAGTDLKSPVENKKLSRSEDGSGTVLEDWIKYALDKLKPSGFVIMIHRADRLDDILLHLKKRRWFGDIEVFPLYPYKNKSAHRVLVRARKGRFGSFILHPGLVLHTDDDTKYTNSAQTILDAAYSVDDLLVQDKI